ncbi:WD40 repeat-containing protein [Singulisphaera acidiphila DSM 18658]|uniref:WD40 repeat-containing protein n=1 Tax=Singulisphaera acidiphila (strain ATCC BAA-1392 / DSM 18658 / VKM B-2454 / MOB10) TaxID=886293 RepID=L0DLY4_SINAD|nr:WD40 repeat domain-containing protein [Singulisphaera acidiphila]AGA30374.1 WD40 repeat-containing protein [Singulisphaera acidiphila DSM 18658]
MKSTPRSPVRALVISIAALGVAGIAIVAGRNSFKPGPTPPPASGERIPVVSAPKEEEKRPGTPQVWVVAIGIDQYRDNAIPSCHGAARAARAVASWFGETAGWNADNVLVMDERGAAEPAKGKNPEGVLPTLANLDWAFKTWLPARVRPDDTVVVYFAGHALGLPPSADAPPGSPGREYLLPIDARRLQWDKSSWALDEAIDGLAASGQNPVVCWLDTSLLGRGERIDPKSTTIPSATPLLQKLVRWPGVTAWLAADGKPAVEAARVGALSPFTAALIDSLGTPERPNNLLAALDRLQQDQVLADQGFRTLGGIDPGLDLWASTIRQASLLKRELLLQRGHAGAVSTLAFSADGTRMISGSQDSTVKIWSVADRKLLRSLAYHMVGVNSLGLNARGDRLVSGDGSGWLRVYDLIKQDEVAPEPPHERGVDQVAFLPDSDLIASLDMDGKSWLRKADDPAGQNGLFSDHSTGIATASGTGPIALAVAEDDGKVALLGAAGKPLAAIDGPGGIVTSRRLATNGELVMAGDDRGQFLVWDAKERKDILKQKASAAVDALAVSPSNRLAVASGKEIRVLALGVTPAAEQILTLPDSANSVTFSKDGRWLAACTTSGVLRLWQLTGPKTAELLPLEDAGTKGQTTSFAFSPDGRKLVSGDQDGGLRTWDLPDGHQRPPVPARRGQVASLSVSGDGRYLLQVSQDRQAQVWDLENGRSLSSLDGDWVAGVLSPDGSRAYLTAEKDGEIVAIDREENRTLPTTYARPEATRQRFGKLAISPDGHWIAAGSLEGPIACLWEASSGTLVQTVRGHLDPHPITSVGFSGDSRHWLTASEDGSVKVWDRENLDPAQAPVASYAMTDPKSGDPVPITAAQLSPIAPRKVVGGGIDGQLFLWDGDARPIDLGSLGHAILAVTFTPDGRWIAAAGADKSVWLWEASQPRRRLRLEPAPQHSEQVNALVAWPNSRIIASGSDDTTIRLWKPEERALLGTLSAQQGSSDWVAYTPDGLFDCSIGGESQVTWFDDKVILTLEQVYDRFHVFKLTDQLRQGDHPKAPAPPRRQPPRLTIDPPPEPVAAQRLTQLKISVAEPNLTNLRLYQNGVPVLSGADLSPDAKRQVVTTPIKLRHGLNRFHVMAGRPGSTEVEGRSQTIEIRYDGPDTPGQIHILAVGVSHYDDKEHALQFADRDAVELSEYLEKNGNRASGSPGLQIVLTNNDVTEAKVDEAFTKIRDRVKTRPEDTVAIFLAGHADTLNGQFHLLLPSFPFSETDPTTGKPKRGMAALDLASKSVLPYVAVYRNLSRLGALQRVVMIDACQAEAIRDDPGVRMIQELVDTEAHRAKTAYLLAARRGEPAGEVAALAHGLMTYALLKGMGDPSLETVPGLTLFNELPSADKNRDGLITTDELRWYTSVTVPRLAANFPQLVMRTGANAQITSFRPTANLTQNAQIQASVVSFPLIELSVPAKPEIEESSPKSEK